MDGRGQQLRNRGMQHAAWRAAVQVPALRRRAQQPSLPLPANLTHSYTMSRARGRRQAPALAAVPEEEAVEAPAGPVAEIMQLLDGLEAAGGSPRGAGWGRARACSLPTAPAPTPPAVDLRVSSLMSAAEDAVMTLKNECKRLLLLMPAKVRRRPPPLVQPCCRLVLVPSAPLAAWRGDAT